MSEKRKASKRKRPIQNIDLVDKDQGSSGRSKRAKKEHSKKSSRKIKYISNRGSYYQMKDVNNKKSSVSSEIHERLQKMFCELRQRHFVQSTSHVDTAKKQQNRWQSYKSHIESTSESTSTEGLIDTTTDEDHSSEEEEDLFEMTASECLHRQLRFNTSGKSMCHDDCSCEGFYTPGQIDDVELGNELDTKPCEPLQNNHRKIFHYQMEISPSVNFKMTPASFIQYGGKEYSFKGFSLFSHKRLHQIPDCSLNRYEMEYTIKLSRTPFPKNFCVRDLDLISDYILKDILELYDLDLNNSRRPGLCRYFHFMPRYMWFCPDSDQREMLGMDVVLEHLLNSFSLLFESPLVNARDWLPDFSRRLRDYIVVKPDKRPRCIRVDDIYESEDAVLDPFEKTGDQFPVIFHLGMNRYKFSFVGSKSYRSLLSKCKSLSKRVNKRADAEDDRRKLAECQRLLDRMCRHKQKDIDIFISSKGFWKTGIGADVCQNALLLPAISHHILYHWHLASLEERLNHRFINRSLLEISLTHHSYQSVYGTTHGHILNSSINCGLRQPMFGVHDESRRRKKGILNFFDTMSNFASPTECISSLKYNEVLEFLGDAVLDVVCCTRLFNMFSEKSEGDLSKFRSALVQNQHLSKIAKELRLEKYILASHYNKSDEVLSGCVEALIGVVYIEGGLHKADEFISRLLFPDKELREIWRSEMMHPLQAEHPDGDRDWISTSRVLKKLVNFEEETGLKFKHIRLLAKAFTHPAASLNSLTNGDNQRLEFLGDAVMKFAVTDYLFKHFPNHHEGHLTLLRSSLVNAKCQAQVACELGLQNYINYGNSQGVPQNVRVKLLADIFEAFLGAVFIDKGLLHCKTICEVCVFTRLEEFILNQDWMDPKSQLQSCCLTLPTSKRVSRYPQYKVLENLGSSDRKVFKVAVYFDRRRIGTGRGKSKRQAEMEAARDALKSNHFEVLRKQKRLLERKFADHRSSTEFSRSTTGR